MGSWGAGGFENDAAADFVAGITSADDVAAELESPPQGPPASRTYRAELEIRFRSD